jgi:hypothetical protein
VRRSIEIASSIRSIAASFQPMMAGIEKQKTASWRFIQRRRDGLFGLTAWPKLTVLLPN